MAERTPFRRVLVANRGEIALRVLRTARRLGLETVAVYSGADAKSPHVAAADQAVHVGPPFPAQSYLDIAAVIEAARRTGADAVHPGYGFLAENADFAQACRDAGLVFVGPSPDAMRAMGDKAAAKQRLRAAGLPCIRGYDGGDDSDGRLLQEAQRIGFPVMVKARAGGGGRGMRLARSAEELPDLLRAARSEARNAFGDGGLLLEKAIASPRHVEVQVFADRHGHAIHLGERDCSVQRRHQKLVEEAPSPAVDAALRDRMGAAAVQAVQAIGYEGAGTLEFLLDAQGQFWFMEMNTRLQVEHAVTEALTGLDLVEWQLRVAAGEPLPLRQDQVRWQGHAIEVRLCAEDAARGFLPQSGTLRSWMPPAGLRVEHALAPGHEVPPYYDSMLAKLVAHGATREEARRRLSQGLRELVALGLPTNQAFLAVTLAHPAFIAGEATTDFVAAQGEDLIAVPGEERLRAACVAAWLLCRGEQRASPLAHRLPTGLRFELDGEPFQVHAVRTGPDRHELRFADGLHGIERVESDGDRATFRLDGVRGEVAFARHGNALWLQLGARAFPVRDRTLEPVVRADAAGGDGQVRASMNGRVAAVLAQPGQAVTAGQPLFTLEAMKMEHVHAAPRAGRLEALHVVAGLQVAAGQVLAEVGVG